MASKKQFPWKNKVCNISQIGGIESSVIDNGPGRGVRIAWINTGSPLRYKVVIDRCLDIVDAFFAEHSLAWISHRGITPPNPAAVTGLEWLYDFPGGLMTTCGLSNIGVPEEGKFGTHGLHGRASNLPAEIVSIVQPEPVMGKDEMSITAVVKQSKVFGPSLVLRRTIRSRLGCAAIWVDDEVTNEGTEPVPHMLLYHCNFGYPLVDEVAEICYKGKCRSRGNDYDDAVFNSNTNFKKCSGPLKSHRGTGEACGFIDLKTDKQGIVTAGIYNPKLQIAVSMSYNKSNLPHMANWQHWGYGDYVTALEPGTNPPMGLTRADEQGDLKFLKPGQSIKYNLQFEVLTKKADIKKFLKKTGTNAD
jgi:hypothetical protein